jgi:hypothetical protein
MPRTASFNFITKCSDRELEASLKPTNRRSHFRHRLLRGLNSGLNWRKIPLSLVDRVNAQIHFREWEEVVVCHFPRKVFNIAQLLEPRSEYSASSFNETEHGHGLSTVRHSTLTTGSHSG